MDNILLGKILKAMYKLSGKSVNELAEESGLTVDTVNNLFYARIQKPGFVGVCALTERMGFTAQDLLYFMKDKSVLNLDVPQITEIIAAYTNAQQESAVSAQNSAKKQDAAVRAAKDRIVSGSETAPVPEEAEGRIREIDQQHERQMDRFRDVHQHYSEQMQRQYEAQLVQMNEDHAGTVRALERMLEERRQRADEAITERDEQLRRQRRTNDILLGLLAGETALAILLVLLKLL